MESQRGHIKRPLNSFMVWAKGRRRFMNMTNPKMRNADISKILGEEWRQMSTSDKQPYIQQAMHLRKKHKIDHPQYRYRPRRKHHTSREERPLFDKVLSNATLLSPAFPSLPNSNTSILGPSVAYSHTPIFPSQSFSPPSVDIAPGLMLSPKLMTSAFYPSHRFSASSTAGTTDYSYPSLCLNDVSKRVVTNGQYSRPTSMSPQTISTPGILSSLSSSNLPYLMVRSREIQYPH